MNYRIFCLTFLFAAPFLTLANSQAATESGAAGFYLSIDEGEPGSAELIRGDFNAAIAEAQSALRTGNRLSAYLTLCVAYIRTDALDEAIAACDEAVLEAKAPITTRRNPYGQKNREGLAKAYLNRGVLHTLLGKPDDARADFELALRQARQTDMVRHNLQLNDARMAVSR